MTKGASLLRSVFKGIARVGATFSIEIGPLRATGVPAVLVSVTGLVLASGAAALLARNAAMIPETLREARGLAETLRGEHPRLNS